MLESVFLNFKPFGVSDSLGERIRVFSVGNVELIFKINSRLACHVHRVCRHQVWKARVWFAVTHYFESENGELHGFQMRC